MNTRERNQLIDALIEGDLPEADFLRLEAELTVDPAARKEYYDRLALSALLEAEAGARPQASGNVVPMPAPARSRVAAFAAMAALGVALLAVGGMLMQQRSAITGAAGTLPAEQKASGFAVLAGQAGTAWRDIAPLADGALIPPGRLQLAAGVAQIELFSGVTVVIEGEAEFEIHSPMEMSVARGKVRARVPEPAHGFRIRTGGGEVVDLGTEFALDVSATHAEVHVLDGEVEWRPRAEAMRRMETGEAVRWGADGRGATLAADASGFVGVAELSEKVNSARAARREDWEQFRATLRRDPRLAAFYSMGASDSWNRRLPNEAVGGAHAVREGAVVAAASAADRWGRPAGALDFSPAGSRVRVTVPGEHRSLTLMCWVKINSLDRWFNSLFLTDGHEQGEPHWQIMDDGRLFFSVKKHDHRDSTQGGRDKHIFYSPAFWDASLSGQWLMIATVYDVDARQVTHYLNGRPLSEEAVPAEYLVEAVRIGNASIGNWSEPMYRLDAEFAVRNLNGSMDEFALFSAALSPKEIEEIYEHGKP